MNLKFIINLRKAYKTGLRIVTYLSGSKQDLYTRNSFRPDFQLSLQLKTGFLTKLNLILSTLVLGYIFESGS